MTATPAKPAEVDSAAAEDYALAEPYVVAAADAIGALCTEEELGRATAWLAAVLGGESPAYWYVKLYGRPD